MCGRIDYCNWILRSFGRSHITISNTHALQRALSYYLRFCVYVWTGENDSNTLRVDANFFKNGGKNLRSQKYPHTCGQGLRLDCLGVLLYRHLHLPTMSNQFMDKTGLILFRHRLCFTHDPAREVCQHGIGVGTPLGNIYMHEIMA